MIELNKIYNTDAISFCRTVPEEFINCCITSPPYYLLKSYNSGNEAEIGLEATPQEYVNKLCNVFDEVKKVLKKDGTLWVNIADTYGAPAGVTRSMPDLSYGDEKLGTRGRQPSRASRGGFYRPKSQSKCLLQIPERFSIEMTNRGWILRNVIIWKKPNANPATVNDRFTVDFEYMYFFVKNINYYFEKQLEPLSESYIQSLKYRGKPIPPGRNKRCVWEIYTARALPGQAKSVIRFPEELVEIPMRAGCPEGGVVYDPFGGMATTAIVAKKLNRNYLISEINPDYVAESISVCTQH